MSPTPPTSAALPIRATRREWFGLVAIALPCMLYSMDLTVLYLAVPAITTDLGPSSTELLWITDIYGFMLAGCLITMGTLGDRIGRRRLLLIGAAAFGTVSVLAAFSNSVEMLLVSRALLGIAAATLAPSTLSLIMTMFRDPHQRRVAISVWIMSFSTGAAIGPVLGGALLEVFWWGSVFLLAVPVMVVLLIVGPRLLPEFRDPDARRIDLPSAALSLAAVLALIYGVKELAVHGAGALAVAFLVAGVGLGMAFVARQHRLDDPLVDLALFRRAAFSTSLTAYTLSLFVLFGLELFVAQYLQLVLDFSPLVAGLWTLPSAGGFVVGALVAPALTNRFDPPRVMTGGLLVAAAGIAGLLLIESGGGLALLVTSSVVFAVGLAPVVTLATDLVVGAAPPERAGSASGLSETGAELGGALGIAILGSIGAAVYRRDIADDLPSGVPADRSDATRDTLAGAIETADDLPAQIGTPLLDAASDAFTSGFHAAALTGAALVLAVALAVGTLLKRGPTPPDSGPSFVAEPSLGTVGDSAHTGHL